MLPKAYEPQEVEKNAPTNGKIPLPAIDLTWTLGDLMGK